ncbi:MAG: dihydrofolate reductase family protein [Candidatus Nomurabacteria bacterium]|jgi:2,5-diamino-6-(ribosylamino)-4(3H)-pyrimidinone 5'-phosphate reductase|nr:dihydrofolate reductase family protein [Candidatus Nomurabacteria bacterium]
MNNRTVNTLFMLMSVDGKISTGVDDSFDFDKDLPEIPMIRDGLQQYYDIEQTTDLWSFISARVLVKTGVNKKSGAPKKTPVSFIVVDNRQHLTESGITYLSQKLARLIIVTTNENYETFDNKNHYGNVSKIFYRDKIDFTSLFEVMKSSWKTDRITIQSGRTLNGVLLREKLVDYINIVVAPLLVGGKDVATLIGGKNPDNLSNLGILELIECKVLDNSYLNLKYKVMK